MRFSIRELVLVTVIVAVAVGWLVNRWQLESQMDRERRSADQVLMVLSKFGFVMNPDTPPGVVEFGVPDNLRDRLGDTVNSQIE